MNEKEAIEAIRKEGMSLSRMSEELRGNKRVVLAAIDPNYNNDYSYMERYAYRYGLNAREEEQQRETRKDMARELEYASKELLEDKEFMINEVLRVNPEGYRYFNEEVLQVYDNMGFINRALRNADKLEVGKKDDGSTKTYLDSMLEQRIEGPTNAGSSYNVNSKDSLHWNLQRALWEETTHPDVMPGCRVFKAKLPGLMGIVDLDKISDNAPLYAIDPKGTGNIGIGAGKVEKTPVDETYIIVGKEEIDGKECDMVFTFHPGEPVRPSQVESKAIMDGTRLTKEEAIKLGLNKAKYMSEDMLQEYRTKAMEIALEKADGVIPIIDTVVLEDEKDNIEFYKKLLSSNCLKGNIFDVEVPLRNYHRIKQYMSEELKNNTELKNLAKDRFKELQKSYEDMLKNNSRPSEISDLTYSLGFIENQIKQFENEEKHIDNEELKILDSEVTPTERKEAVNAIQKIKEKSEKGKTTGEIQIDE